MAAWVRVGRPRSHGLGSNVRGGTHGKRRRRPGIAVDAECGHGLPPRVGVGNLRERADERRKRAQIVHGNLMVELRVGVAAADGAHKPLSRQQRYARTLKIAACAVGARLTPRTERERAEGASGNLFCAQFPECRGGSPWSVWAPRMPNTPALPAWWKSAMPATRQTVKGAQPTLAVQLRALLRERPPRPVARQESGAVGSHVGRGFCPETVPGCFPGCAGGLPRPTGGRVAIFPTSAFMEMRHACQRNIRAAGGLDAGRRYRAVAVWGGEHACDAWCQEYSLAGFRMCPHLALG